MESVKLITQSMLNIMRPLLEQVEIISSSIESQNEDFPETQVDDICSPLLQVQDELFSDDVLMLKIALKDFYDALDVVKKNEPYEPYKDVFKKLLKNVYGFLIKQDTYTIKIIQALITKCNMHFLKFISNINDEESKQLLEVFVVSAEECLKKVKERIEDLIFKKQRQQLLLCVRQISKCVPLLVLILSSNAKKTQLLCSFLSKRISWCFVEMGKAMQNSADSFKNQECGGQFVHKMDLALDLVSTGFIASTEELKTVVEEVLCHAMSIAHVAVHVDNEAISRSCQKVLKSLQEVRQEHVEEFHPMRELLLGSLSAALEQLERRVNVALLRLLLEVFSSLFAPLNRLLEAVDGSKPLNSRRFEDLNEDVSVFDLQMDRIMQIGLFAIACSENTKRIVGIRSCLASLESLEPELIPAITSLYLEPANLAQRSYLQIIVCHWKEEVLELQTLLHGLVDPAAFCEVTLQDMTYHAASIKGKLSNITKQDLTLQVDTMLKKATLLQRQLNVFKEEHATLVRENLKVVEDFQLSLHEFNATSRLFLLNTHVDVLGNDERRRLLKRCELLVSTIKRVQLFLHNSSGSICRDNITASKPENVFVEEEAESMKNNFTELVKRGRSLLKERSILYCTPKKNWEKSVKLKCLQTPQIRSHSIFNKTVCSKKFPVDISLGLDISNILENLTLLSDTLASKHSSIDSMCQTETDGSLGAACEAIALTSSGMTPVDVISISSLKVPATSRSTFDLESFSQEVDSIQRMDDLRTVEEKITNLRANAVD